METVYQLGEKARCTVIYRINANGVVDVTEHYEGAEGLPELPCFGMSWKLPKAFRNITWYGLGPEETYVDRRRGGRMGVHKTVPESGMSGYVVPQECGNHVDTRWLKVQDEQGTGIWIHAEMPFEFSALPYTCHELESARHHYELPSPYAVVLRILGAQTGVGGDNSWGAWAHEQYILDSSKDREFHFTIRMLV